MGARIARFGVVTLVVAVLAGCGASGGAGSGGGAAETVVAVDPVYLAPGRTVAALAWEASEGPVDNYIVFESRNGSPFSFSTVALTPTVDVVGAPGDSVQITVVAISPHGEMSETSPPSPPFIFQAAEAVNAVAQATPQGAAPQPVSTELVATDDDANDLAANAANAAADDTANDASQAPELGSDESEETPMLTQLVQSMRALLLGGDTRLPESGLSTEADQWLQAQVDHEIAAGVSLAGTGRADDDALREIVWQDQAGQLFVSDGATFLDASDLPATLAEGLRLNATERFVGLADFDGDGRGDWLLEDTATGDVWIVNGATDLSDPPAVMPTETTLLGHGDFDGDGVAELLWINASRTLTLSSANLEAPQLSSGSAQPNDTELLAIADFDGNGLDDLLARTADGSLLVGFAVTTSEGAPVSLDWQTGAALPAEGLDLVATLDVDEDGAAEIAWLNGDDLEIWNAEAGLQQRLAL